MAGESLIGKRFTRWLVVAQLPFKKEQSTAWLCRCDCGTERAVSRRALVNDRSKSCGCLASEMRRAQRLHKRKPCGTVAAYRRGCRCDPCRNASTEASRKWEASPAAIAARASRRAERMRTGELRDVQRFTRMAIRYGITPQQAENIFESQGFRCGACETDDPGTKLGWQIDHDHETGLVRGILCQRCNVTLGSMGDNEIGVLRTAQRMLAYLRREIG